MAVLRGVIVLFATRRSLRVGLALACLVFQGWLVLKIFHWASMLGNCSSPYLLEEYMEECDHP